MSIPASVLTISFAWSIVRLKLHKKANKLILIRQSSGEEMLLRQKTGRNMKISLLKWVIIKNKSMKKFSDKSVKLSKSQRKYLPNPMTSLLK